jgi:predicted trehalose synthase
LVFSLVLLLGLACEPSDEDVARAAEESISRLASLAVANMSCSVDEAFGSGGPSTGIMEKFTNRMEGLTDALQHDGEASNRDKMRVIEEMDALYQDWESELEEAGCEVLDS